MPLVMKPGACGPAPCGSGVSPPTRLGNILKRSRDGPPTEALVVSREVDALLSSRVREAQRLAKPRLMQLGK
jgi:hypothetical protein